MPAVADSGGRKYLDNLEQIVDFVLALEDAVETVSVDDGEGRLVEPIDRDRAVPGDVVLEQREEPGLLRRQLADACAQIR